MLYYQKVQPKGAKKGERGDRDDGVRAINLLICTVSVREKETGKRFCFDVVSPYRSYTLQARQPTAVSTSSLLIAALRGTDCEGD